MTILAKSTSGLTFKHFGIPAQVVSVETVPLDAWTEDHVYLKMMASPVNPSDLLTIQGIYPAKVPQYGESHVPGLEGVARVEAVGKNVTQVQVGDYVLPALSGFGTWRQEIICPAKNVMKVPNTVPIKALATLAINPTTALRMLEDYVALKPGDVIAQNAANSTVGQAVIQMARARGIKTINIMRDKPDFKDHEKFLKELGADVVLKEGDLLPYLKANPNHISLAFNAVGGQSGTDLACAMGKKGVLVTYGRLSEAPMNVPVADFIFKDIRLCGFWLSEWITSHTTPDFQKMYAALFTMLQNGTLRVPPMEEFQFSELKQNANLIPKLVNETGRKCIIMF